MKIKFRKSYIALLAAVILEACSLVNNAAAPFAINSQAPYMLSRNFSNRHLPVQRSQQQTTQAINLPANTQGSSNWAGYIAAPASTKNSYTSVSGSWTVPNITASRQNAAAAQWIGLGGVSSNDLLQMGTIEDIENGQPVAHVFWEKLPAAAQYVTTVPIGSTINARITPSADSDLTWDLTYTVNGKTLSKTIPAVPLDSFYAQGIGTSAEWISEDPSNENNQLIPLANMGTVSYTSALVNDEPLNSKENNIQPVAMVSNNRNILIAPSRLGNDGKSFTTSIVNTSSRPNRRSHSSWNLSNSQGYSVDYDGWTFIWTWSR